MEKKLIIVRIIFNYLKGKHLIACMSLYYSQENFLSKEYSCFTYYIQKFRSYGHFPRVPIFGHQMRCESLEAGFAEKVSIARLYGQTLMTIQQIVV